MVAIVTESFHPFTNIPPMHFTWNCSLKHTERPVHHQIQTCFKSKPINIHKLYYSVTNTHLVRSSNRNDNWATSHQRKHHLDISSITSLRLPNTKPLVPSKNFILQLIISLIPVVFVDCYLSGRKWKLLTYNSKAEGLLLTLSLFGIHLRLLRKQWLCILLARRKSQI